MDDDLIWTRDDIVRFTHHHDDEVRAWAWWWLVRHHPEEAGRQAARGVADPSVSIALEVLGAYEAHPTPEAEAAIEALRARDDLAPELRAAIERLDQPAPPQPAPSAFELLMDRFDRNPEELRRRAPAMMLSADPRLRIDVFAALGRQQHRWATDLILEHFVAIVTSHEDTFLWDALEELLDPRTLPAILSAWSPGQLRAARLYAHIHRVAGLTGPLPEGIARDAEESARRAARHSDFLRSTPRPTYTGPRRIELFCAACHRTGEYELDPPTMAKLAETLTPRNNLRVRVRFPCKFCDRQGGLHATMISAFSVLGGAMAYEDERKRLS